MASSAFAHLTQKVFVEILANRSIEEKAIRDVSIVTDNWMKPIREYLEHGKLPEEQTQARKIRVKAPNYAIKNGVMYKKGYLSPWLRCLDKNEAEYIIAEAHEGLAGAHEGPRTVAQKIARLGYFWPTMYRDAQTAIFKCDKCQKHAPIPRIAATPLISISSPWPFSQWGIDIVGPFLDTLGKIKFLVVAVDYFSKWVEAQPLATINGQNIVKFFWKQIICRFGLPSVVISDNDKQFANNPFREWCEQMRIKQRFTSVAHPEANGQTEVTNRTIVRGLAHRLEQARGLWVEELPSVLWAYRTTPRTATKETPFSLVYGSEAVIPPELLIPSTRVTEHKGKSNDIDIRTNLELLTERREIAAIRQEQYKRATENYYNQRVKHRSFKVGDLVLRQNKASKQEQEGNMCANWEGPYKVVESNRDESYILETTDNEAVPRSWNIKNLRRFLC